MKKSLKIVFHLLNLILIIFYIYPGSIFGWIIYDDFSHQPQITRDFVIKYLFLLSIVLELFHIFIPERNFQFSDLFGNILGVIIPFAVYKIWKKI